MIIEIYRGEDKRWHWRLTDMAGKVLCQSVEPKVKRSAAIAAVKRVQDGITGARIVEHLS